MEKGALPDLLRFNRLWTTASVTVVVAAPLSMEADIAFEQISNFYCNNGVLFAGFQLVVLNQEVLVI